MKKVTTEVLNEITRRIVEKIHPEKVILFGSYAWGEPKKSSDVDLFIIVPHSEDPPYRRGRAIYHCLRGMQIPVDVIVLTHDEFERSKRVITSISRRVLEKGKVLYG